MFSNNGESDIITPYKVVRILKVINILAFPIWIITYSIDKLYHLLKRNI